MASKLHELNAIDNRTKLIIFGYIRKEQQLLTLLHKNNPFYVIAKLIIHCIFSFYHEPEYFAKAPNNVAISNNKCTVTVTETMDTTCYGARTIESTLKMIHRWKFIIQNSEYNCTGIGIDEAPGTSTNDDFYKNRKKNNYIYKCIGRKWSQYIYDDYGINYSNNDVVEMILNLIDGKLSFLVNNVDQ